jgi:hypothetical protein
VSRLRKRLALPPGDWWLLARAFALTLFVRGSLRLIPFRILRRLVRARRRPAHPGTPTVARIAWAVEASARRVPDATCLTQALVAETLLHRAGHEAILHLGVARPGEDESRIEAHAWVMSEGQVVVGGGELDRFTRLPVPERWTR